MKQVYLLGATGSIGSQTIEIIEAHPDQFQLVAISGYNNLDRIVELAYKFPLELISVKDKKDAKALKNIFPDVTIVHGDEGLVALSTLNPDNKEAILINALVGMVGLRPTVEAIKIDRDVLLANKETLVVGGHIVSGLLQKHKGRLYPIDSEHNAIWQILNGENKDKIRRLIITASGGPFRDMTRDELSQVTLSDALAHPNWSMGKKITVDSATMMNKGFEIIEAAFLFDIDITKIEAIIHRESIVHSLVEFNDYSIIAQMANHDMRLPISYAMFYPERQENLSQPLDFHSLKALHFEPVSYQRYPLVRIAIECYQKGGSFRTALNAANEAAVQLFLQEKIHFTDIETIIIKAVNEHQFIENPSIEEIYQIDNQIKTQIYARYDK